MRQDHEQRRERLRQAIAASQRARDEAPPVTAGLHAMAQAITAVGDALEQLAQVIDRIMGQAPSPGGGGGEADGGELG